MSIYKKVICCKQMKWYDQVCSKKADREHLLPYHSASELKAVTIWLSFVQLRWSSDVALGSTHRASRLLTKFADDIRCKRFVLRGWCLTYGQRSILMKAMYCRLISSSHRLMSMIFPVHHRRIHIWNRYLCSSDTDRNHCHQMRGLRGSAH